MISSSTTPRRRVPSLALALAIVCPAAWAQLLAPSPPAVPAAEAPPASPALVNHLVRVLERREQPPATGAFGAANPAALSMIDALDAERQLRGLGARAASGAPRVAELLARTERNAYELTFTLWAISAPPGAEPLSGLQASLAQATGAARLELLARIGRSRAPQAIPVLREASRAAELPQRLVAGVALGFQNDAATGDEPARLLAAMLKDPDKPARHVAANGLRLLGTRAQAAVPALIEYLRTRDNVYMATSALAVAPARELMPAQGELEAILGDSKLSDFQKQPAVQLLMRIEQQRGLDAANGAAPVPKSPAVMVPPPPRAADASRT